MSPSVSNKDWKLQETDDSLASDAIVVLDAVSEQTVCRVSCAGQLRSSVEPSDSEGKLVDEVLEVVRGLTGCSNAVIMDGPDARSALAFTRSDRIPPQTYYLHLPGSMKQAERQQANSWQAQVAAVIVAMITLGAVMQSLIFMVAVPYCGCNWKCLHHWFKTFISHIDGPFKVFTFIAAIQRAAAHPNVWLDGFGQLSGAITRLLKGDDGQRPVSGRDQKVMNERAAKVHPKGD